MEKCKDCILGVQVRYDGEYLTESNIHRLSNFYRKKDLEWATSGRGLEEFAKKAILRTMYQTIDFHFDLFKYCPECGSKNTFDV